MEKTDLLFKMLDNSEEYTARQWQEILEDDECRELYRLMALTRSAIIGRCSPCHVSDEEMDDEWQRLTHHRPTQRWWLGRAAAIVGLAVLLTSLAWAAFTIGVFGIRQNQQEASPAASDHAEQQATPAGTAETRHLYQNAPLAAILHDLALRYDVDIRCPETAATELRLSFSWDEAEDLGRVAARLDHFERLEVTYEQNRLTVNVKN